jgi:hypothetical protein
MNIHPVLGLLIVIGAFLLVCFLIGVAQGIAAVIVYS